MRNHNDAFAHTPDPVAACKTAAVHDGIPGREMVAITAKLSRFKERQKD